MTRKRKRVLVSGSTGFVGRNLIPVLLADGFELILPVRDVTMCPKSFRENPRVRIVHAGQYGEQIDEALRGVFGVVHLAGLAHIRNPREPEVFKDANAGVTARLVEGVKKAGNVSFFIHMSSLAAITDNASSRTVDDAAVPEPASDYGLSKLQAEAYVAGLAQHGISAISLRPPLIVGAGAKGNWASLQRLAATGLPLPFGGIHNRRSLVSVQTVTQAISHLCYKVPSPEKSGNYCLADPEPLSLTSILAELRIGLGMTPRLFRFPASALAALGYLPRARRIAASLFDDLVVDASRFYSVFDFQSTVPLREAIRKSGSDYRA